MDAFPSVHEASRKPYRDEQSATLCRRLCLRRRRRSQMVWTCRETARSRRTADFDEYCRRAKLLHPDHRRSTYSSRAVRNISSRKGSCTAENP